MPANRGRLSPFDRLPLVTKDNYLRCHPLPELARGKRAGRTNPVADSVSRYDTADAGVLGNETPVSVSVRRFLAEREISRLPFVYVFVRSLFAVSYFGANVFPENVVGAVERADVNAWVTGKFVGFVGADPAGEPRLQVMVEIAPEGLPPAGATTLLADAVRSDLHRLNSEFANYVPEQYQTPIVELRPPGDPESFPVGVKHRYTRT